MNNVVNAEESPKKNYTVVYIHRNYHLPILSHNLCYVITHMSYMFIINSRNNLRLFFFAYCAMVENDLIHFYMNSNKVVLVIY